MPCCESLSLEGIEEHDEQLELSLQFRHTVDKDRSIGWHQVNKRTQRSRYAALSCLSTISCAVADTDSAALPSSSFRLFFLPPPQLATTSFNLQRSPRRFFLSVLSGPRVGQSTRIIALRARARSDTCRDHRPPSCTLGHRLTTLSFHRFYERNQPIIPHVICWNRDGIFHLKQYNTSSSWSVTRVHAVTKQQPLWLSLPFRSVAARTRLPLSIHPSIHPSIYPSTPRSIRLNEQQESSRLGIKFSSIPTLTFSSSTPGSRTGATIGLDAGRICHSCCVSGEGLARVPAAASVCVITVHDRWATIKKARYVHGGVSERVAPY